MTVLNILEILAKRSLEKGISKFVSLSLIALCLLLLVNNVNMSNNGILKVNNHNQILEENSFVKQISEVLSDQTNPKELIVKPNSFASEIAWAGLLADRKFIWDYYGGYLSGSDSEILIRYMCNLRRDFFEISDIPKIELTQGHRFENANQHFGNWLFLSRYLNLLEDKSESALLAREINRISRVLPFRGEERCKEFKNFRETKILIFGDPGPIVSP
jgi:hypothetical protein